MEKREFTVANEYRYNRAGPLRWIVSHILRYPWLPGATILLAIAVSILTSTNSVLVGRAFDLVAAPGTTPAMVLHAALVILAIGAGQGIAQLLRNLAVEMLAQLVERDARDELYLSLLGKSLTFHGRQRIGDIMARATNDVHMLNLMISPGLVFIFAALVGLIVPIAAIPLNLRWDLLLSPLVFVVLFVITLRRYIRELDPVVGAVRERFGLMNARLAETIEGIQVVKGSAQERQEQNIFLENARKFRDMYVLQGKIEGRYLPLLMLSVTTAGAFLHALLLYRQGALTVGEVVAYMGLLRLLGFPTFISIWTFALIQLGVASARRILELINTETELDENPQGVAKPIRGEIEFDHVSFSYDGTPVLHDISFRANPGETIAIVGETGSGKSTLTKLVNRTYDVTAGRVLVDGVDVRDWNMASLRSQISAIEQDIFLFSRSIADNIAFGAPETATMDDIRRAAREAQAHDFIMSFANDYATEIGERGVTLSGGQRQRLAIARAFLTDPRILILDDSTSAIDSATEDEIQKAMRRIMKGRTTLLITHRLSQIRWADRILVLRRGRLVDQGTHDELLARCEAYRRIFARYGAQAEEKPRPEAVPQAGASPSGACE
ncbi:MAG: ABC transporter ATP-binding protein [Anaerolineae bacterium]|nr:ABC transporter ATP-binding protein [Anaerolineae bacterium]